MPRFIALLRGINVGGHVVTMDRLRTVFGSLGFAGVETFIASGNVIFETPLENAQALERRIERRLREALGYEVATFLRSPAELAAIASYEPFPAAEPVADRDSLYVAFLRAPPGTTARRKLMAFRTGTDDLHVRGREVYWLCRTKMSESAFSGALLEKTVAMPATLRNVTTVRRLAARYPAIRNRPPTGRHHGRDA